MRLQIHRRAFTLASLIALTIGAAHAQDDTLVSRYQAVLSAQDRMSEDGLPLHNIGAVLMRDRANYFQYGRADAGDEADRIFMTAESQRLVHYMLDPAAVPAPIAAAIAEGRDIVVAVEIRRGPKGDYLRLERLGEP